MVEIMLDFMLGPLRNITNFYMSHIVFSNSLVLLSYLAVRFINRQKNKTDLKEVE
nr:hypothetical protein [Staphylococcus agnetis]